ncbi:mediator complex subunit [Pleurotus pulmonarius]|nr:mediator complex subunit [Pleurotus pulmonarius]
METEKVGFHFSPHEVVPTLDPKLYSLNEEEAAFFKYTTGIQDEEELKKHILDVQAKAYAIFGYSCIRRFWFLRLNICKLPAYKQVLKLATERQGAIFLDLACCFGNDVRKVVADGWPIQNAIASDLRQGFWDAGHKLFETTPETYPLKFIPGDVFDPAFIAPRDPFYELPSTPLPDLQSLTSLSPLQGHIAAVHASAFVHLFDEEQQTQVCRALASLISPEPGSTIFGAHAGALRKGVRVVDLAGGVTRRMFFHDPNTWKELWDGGIFKKGSVKVEAQLVEHKREDLTEEPDREKTYFITCTGSRSDRGSSIRLSFVLLVCRADHTTLVSNFHVMNNAPKQEVLPAINGAYTNGAHEPSLVELENELPQVNDEMVPLGELLSRVVQSIYAELTEMAETLPNMSDAARKRLLADWVVRTKKQVVKLYATAKWARDADVAQKCMNITAFVLTQQRQFEDAIGYLETRNKSLNAARLGNHDLLTSLDVLTTGSYRRLPSAIKKAFIPPPPLTDFEVRKTLIDIEDAMRFRLRTHESIPVEMCEHHVADGRVYFTVPHLFETSVCLKGAEKDDGWFFVHVEFLINIGGDLTGMEEFPRQPTGILKRHITDEANNRLGYYLPTLPPPAPLPPGFEPPSAPQLPEGFVDAPLVRLFNFLQMMSLSYQLEILWYQAERMRSLGWADYLSVKMSPDRKSFIATYWVRPPRTAPTRAQARPIPLQGGTLTISIVQAKGPPQAGSGPTRTPKQRVLAELEHRLKLGVNRPSDEVEGLKFEVKWEQTPYVLAMIIPPELLAMAPEELTIHADSLDFESLLRKVIEKHIKAIFTVHLYNLARSQKRTVFSAPGVVTMVSEPDFSALRIHLCANEEVLITIDARTGRLSLRDSADLAAASRGIQFNTISDLINDNPLILYEALLRLRMNTIIDFTEQKAKYLGLQCYRTRSFPKEAIAQKFGSTHPHALYIQLANFPDYYLVLVIGDGGFRYAVIAAESVLDPEIGYHTYKIALFQWLDVQGILQSNAPRQDDPGSPRVADASSLPSDDVAPAGFNIETKALREVYSYCCALVACKKVQDQLKARNIACARVNPAGGTPSPGVNHIQSSLARYVPALCVQSKDILSGAPAAEAAMPNIRIIPLNWWSEKQVQVVTCVKLKYVQQPTGKTTGALSAVIRPSKRIIYDTKDAVVSFLSEDVNTCVDEFLEEWARVSKMVVIAREVAQMAKDKKWGGVKLLSFDLQTVKFAYMDDYTVSITCMDQLSPTGGTFDLRFSRTHADDAMDEGISFNPHDDAEPFLRSILRQGHGRLAPSLHRLVGLLRDTLPIVVALEDIRLESFNSSASSSKALAGLDTFAKAAGWYRILYGDLRHALDFRLMHGRKVVILDGSHSLFSKTASEDDASSLGLRPLPKLREAIAAAVKEVRATAVQGRIAPIDVGVVCDCAVVRPLAKALHAQILLRLNEQPN